MENMIKVIIALAIVLVVILGISMTFLLNLIGQKKAQVADLDKKISNINQYLKENESVSSELFDEGDEIRMGLVRNKNIYTYYTIVGTEIPKKLWLTSLELGDNTTIEGQADNLESVYSFFRNIKDYDPNSNIKLQKLGPATISSSLQEISETESFDTDSVITSLNADYYQFRISDAPEIKKTNITSKKQEGEKGANNSAAGALPDLEPIE